MLIWKNQKKKKNSNNLSTPITLSLRKIQKKCMKVKNKGNKSNSRNRKKHPIKDIKIEISTKTNLNVKGWKMERKKKTKENRLLKLLKRNKMLWMRVCSIIKNGLTEIFLMT